MTTHLQPSSYHIFSLPRELLHALVPRPLLLPPSSLSISSIPVPAPNPNPRSAPSELQTAAQTSKSCALCLNTSFPSVDAQRAHYRSDWHRYNVQIRSRGQEVVGEERFAELVEGLEDSLSGSESSSEDDDEGSDSDAVSALVRKTKALNRLASHDDEGEDTRRTAPQTALAWFHASSPPVSVPTQIGVYRAVFSSLSSSASSGSGERYLDELKAMQERTEDGRTWALFMVAGGHFAGAVVRVARGAEEEQDEGGAGKKKRVGQRQDVEVLMHKTFHRYTTRRKQGGGQSVNDNAKGNAKSAGAQLRRYGEQALRDDIRGLLAEWSDLLDACERVWIRASGANRRIFLDYEGAVLWKGDERVRGFPFPTRRPTQKELTRCLYELTRVKVEHLSEVELRERDEEVVRGMPKPRPVPSAASVQPKEKTKPSMGPTLTKEEEAMKERWIRVLEMVGKGRVEALAAFWAREGGGEGLGEGSVDARCPAYVGERERWKGWTVLMVAAREGQEGVVRWLVEEGRADPTVDVPSRDVEADGDGADEEEKEGYDADERKGRRTAYDLAANRATRDMFRRLAAQHAEWWDWLGAGRVPSVLTGEMEEGREEKRKVRRKGLKERMREREKMRPDDDEVDTGAHDEKEKEEEKGKEGPRRLGGSGGKEEAVTGLSAEMRAKVERERRARAAEARMRALGGGG